MSCTTFYDFFIHLFQYIIYINPVIYFPHNLLRIQNQRTQRRGRPGHKTTLPGAGLLGKPTPQGDAGIPGRQEPRGSHDHFKPY